MNPVIDELRAEERAARARLRAGEKGRREAQRAAERRARQTANARRQIARREREQLQPALRRTRRAYYQALNDAVKDRARDTLDDAAARWDLTDRRMDAYLAVIRRDQQLARAARA